MIKVTIYQNSEQKISGFYLQGHVGVAEEGSDLVWEEVSALEQNAVNSMEAFTEDGFTAEADAENGELYVRLEPGYSEKTALLLDSLILGLQGIEEEYMEYVDVIFKEV